MSAMFECPSLFSLLGVVMHCIFAKNIIYNHVKKVVLGIGHWVHGSHCSEVTQAKHCIVLYSFNVLFLKYIMRLIKHV